MTLTQAEMEAKYDAERDGSAWEKVHQITDNPTNDGAARFLAGYRDGLAIGALLTEDTPISPAEEAAIRILYPDIDNQILDILTNDTDDGSEEDEAQPVPPVPAGYPTDRAFIYQYFGDVMITIDRRDCEMLICRKGDMEGIIVPPDMALALAQFLNQADIREITAYHRGAASVGGG